MPDDQPTGDLLSLYSLFLQDITFCKQQQWSVTNYALLFDAALVGIGGLPKGAAFSPSLCGLAIGAAVGALCVLSSLQQSIATARERIDRVFERLERLPDATLRDVLGARDKKSAFVLWLLRAAIFAGAVAVVWLLWPKASVTSSSYFLP